MEKISKGTDEIWCFVFSILEKVRSTKGKLKDREIISFDFSFLRNRTRETMSLEQWTIFMRKMESKDYRRIFLVIPEPWLKRFRRTGFVSDREQNVGRSERWSTNNANNSTIQETNNFSLSDRWDVNTMFCKIK